MAEIHKKYLKEKTAFNPVYVELYSIFIKRLFLINTIILSKAIFQKCFTEKLALVRGNVQIFLALVEGGVQIFSRLF